MYRAQPATHTDPSVSLYYFLSEPDCPPRIPGRGELRAESVGGYRLSLSPWSYSNSCLLSPALGDSRSAGGAESIMRQVTQETPAMVTGGQN